MISTYLCRPRLSSGLRYLLFVSRGSLLCLPSSVLRTQNSAVVPTANYRKLGIWRTIGERNLESRSGTSEHRQGWSREATEPLLSIKKQIRTPSGARGWQRRLLHIEDEAAAAHSYRRGSVIFCFVSRGCARLRGLTPASPLASLRDSEFRGRTDRKWLDKRGIIGQGFHTPDGWISYTAAALWRPFGTQSFAASDLCKNTAGVPDFSDTPAFSVFYTNLSV